MALHSGGAASLYGIGAVLFVWHSSGGAAVSREGWLALAGAAAVVWGVYAIDRVKLRDAWREPGDGSGLRKWVVRRHGRWLRTMAAMMVLVGSVLLGLAAWQLAGLGLLGVGAVLAYDGRPHASQTGRGVRVGSLKRSAAAKNGMVAVAYVVLAGSVSAALSGQAIAGVLAALFVRVLIDAALCDLDDIDADRAAGVTTLGTSLGRRRALAVLTAAELGPLALLGMAGTEWAAGVTVYGVTPLASTLAAAMIDRLRLTDLVDMRLGVLGLLAVLIHAAPA
ncbi:MAG: UbiA family prenyltransferase [Planctomycetota bacterium]